ncbi:MAG: glycosyltransferase family 4 protein [Candidatus Azobacteroides sp.]|nr:glycosyltransferase family 4 protein [Candidatus Azobacteroides sp.]
MHTLKVGIWLDSNYKPTAGGGYSYYDKLIKHIDEYDFPANIEIVFLSESTTNPQFKKSVKNISLINNCFRYDNFILKCFPPLFKYFRKIRRIIENPYYRSLFRKLHIDALYYLKQEECHISNYPFIATNWDIGHISTYPFPEIKKDFHRRKRFYENILPKAIFVFCESESGKKELMKYTSVEDFKIKTVPIFSGDTASIVTDDMDATEFLNKCKLVENEYYFYPAQFWSHKNHYGLLLAFARIVHDHPNLKLVFTGSDKGNLQYIKDVIIDLGLENHVLILGFISSKEINILYKNAISLVMPTYLGPSNMPPIEAMELNCPVICSDLSGHKEILGDSALYFDPHDITSIEMKMREILNNEKRNDMIKKLYLREKESKYKVEYAIKKIEEYLLELLYIRKTWK